MTHTTLSKHISNLAFDAQIDGHTIRFDGKEGNSGPRPKAIILNSLAICAGFDLVIILDKMKIVFSELSIKTTGDLSISKPSIYEKIYMEFILKVNPEHQQKVKRAVKLSTEKYCGVYAMLIKVCPLTTSIKFL